MMDRQEQSDSSVLPTEEVLEQSRATGGGGDGGKGTGQEEFAAVDRPPDTGPGQGGTWAGADTAGGEARQGGAIHCVAPPRVRRRHAAGGVLQPQAGCRTGRRRRDVAALRGGPGRQLAGPVAQAEGGNVPGNAGTEDVHPEGRRPATTVRGDQPGGQGCPTGGGGGIERHLRNGVPGILVRVPTGAQPAQCAGCLGPRADDEKSGVGA